MINPFDFNTLLTSRGKQLEYLFSVPSSVFSRANHSGTVS